MPRGDFAGEQIDELVVPLPGMHGHEAIVGRVQAAVGQARGEGGMGGRVELGGHVFGVAAVGAAGELGPAGMGRNPDKPNGRGGFRRIGSIIDAVEADTPAIGDKRRVAFGHRRLDTLKIAIDEIGGPRPAVGDLVGHAVERGGDFFQIDGQRGRADTEHVAQLGDERDRIQGCRYAVDRLFQRAGFDMPVLEFEHPGGKAILNALFERQCIHVLVVGLFAGCDQQLVAEFGEHLGGHPRIGGGPGGGIEVGDGLFSRGHGHTGHQAESLVR